MPAYTPLEERFWSKVEKAGPDDCWLWTGAKQKSDGGFYGRIRMPRQRRTEFAHRVSFMLTFGDCPPNRIICHRCGNSLCVNPAHLYAGTPTENNMDRVRHGRQAGGANAGEAHHMARLDWTTVKAIRRLLREGATQKSLCQRFGISRAQMSRIARNQSWVVNHE